MIASIQWRRSFLSFEIQSHGNIKEFLRGASSLLHHFQASISFRINRSQTRIDTLITPSFQYLKSLSRLEAIRCFNWNFPFVLDNVKPKKPVDLTVLKNDQELLDDDDDSMDSEDDEKDDLDDLADDTELSDDPNADDDEEDDDEYDDSDQDWDTTSSSTTYSSKFSTTSTTTIAPTTRSTSAPTPDPYFTHFDPRYEHQHYKEAQVRNI